MLMRMYCMYNYLNYPLSHEYVKIELNNFTKKIFFSVEDDDEEE